MADKIWIRLLFVGSFILIGCDMNFEQFVKVGIFVAILSLWEIEDLVRNRRLL